MRPTPRWRGGAGKRPAVAGLLSRLVLAGLLLGGLALGGCGSVSGDLFGVVRSGSEPGARLTLVVSDDGSARCNGGGRVRISDPLLLGARDVQTNLRDLARRATTLPAGRSSVLSYQVQSPDGRVSFADDSPGQPPVLYKLALLTRQIAQQVCHLPR